jgi:3-oxosteroid 1-dehydrogenase
MYPFRESGPYYCVLICGVVLDTNGGSNAASQVLRPDGSAIPGLYGAGNCVASVACDGYMSLGSSLGLAAMFAPVSRPSTSRESRPVPCPLCAPVPRR